MLVLNAIKEAIKRRGHNRPVPAALTEEAEGIAATIDHFNSLHFHERNRHGERMREYETWHAGELQRLQGEVDALRQQFTELTRRLPKRPCNESYRPQPQ